MPLPEIFRQATYNTSFISFYDTSTPWIDGDYIYATDGCILVWCRRCDHPDFESPPLKKGKTKRINVHLVIGKTYDLPYTVSLPDPPPLEECPHCGAMTCEPEENDVMAGVSLHGTGTPKKPIRLSCRYVRLLKNSGVVEVRVGMRKNPVRFEHPTGSFAGFLMPLRDEE